MVVRSILFWGGGGGVVEFLTFKGEFSTKKETPDIISPEVGISAFLYSKYNIVILPTLPDIVGASQIQVHVLWKFPSLTCQCPKVTFELFKKCLSLKFSVLSLQIQKCFSSSYDFCTVFAHTLYFVLTTDKTLSWKQMLFWSVNFVPHGKCRKTLLCYDFGTGMRLVRG